MACRAMLTMAPSSYTSALSKEDPSNICLRCTSPLEFNAALFSAVGQKDSSRFCVHGGQPVIAILVI